MVMKIYGINYGTTEKLFVERKTTMLTWNVYYEDFNNKCIRSMNVFEHSRFYTDCIKNAKQNKNDKETFLKQLQRDLRYYYWSKCEWEIILTSWPERKDFNDEKIDVSEQIELNWDRFAEYVWEHRAELK